MAHTTPDHARQRIDHALALPMFCCAFIFLLLLAGLLQWVNHPQRSPHSWHPLAVAMGLLWFCMVAEVCYRWRRWGKQPGFLREHKSFLLAICLPPLRVGSRYPALGGQIYLPFVGWHRVDEALRDTLDDLFRKPMIVIALCILPLLLVEYQFAAAVNSHWWLALGVGTGESLVWLAFTLEFILKISVARNKLTYCKKNWLDIAIILLPFIGFLRPLRMLRTSQLARMSRLGRTYRLRVLGTRLIQHVMLMAAVRRLLYRAPEKELQKWHVLLTEKEEEVQAIKQKIAHIEQEIAAQPLTPSPATIAIHLPCRSDDDVIG